jgi:hypothetical protein
VTKNGFRNDDFTPYIYRTVDGGKTWASIAGDLPRAPINVILQDRAKPNLLFVGNDLGVWVSVDDGAHWTRWKANLPTVAVHDLTIHPRENDLVVGTYGRTLWVGNMQPLRELTAELPTRAAYLFDMKPAVRYDFGTQGMNYALNGDKYIRVPNEPEGISVYYWLGGGDSTRVQIAVSDSMGTVVRRVSATGRRGVNRVVIPFQPPGQGRGRGAPPTGVAAAGGGRGAGRGGSPSAENAVLSVGRYSVTIDVGDDRLTKPAIVRERIQSKQP